MLIMYCKFHALHDIEWSSELPRGAGNVDNHCKFHALSDLEGSSAIPHDREMFIIFLQMRKNVVHEAAKCLNYNRDVSQFLYISAIMCADVWHPLLP